MMRQRFFQDLDAIAADGEPKAIVRDPELNHCIELPIIGRKQFIEGLTRDEIERERPGIAPRREFPFLVGQPDSVRRAYDEAMGLKTDPCHCEERSDAAIPIRLEQLSSSAVAKSMLAPCSPPSRPLRAATRWPGLDPGQP